MNEQHLRILVVTAHPHDFTHCAGTLGVHTSLGDSVTVVAVAPGVYTHNERLYDELMKPLEERDASIVDQSLEAYAAMKEDELRRAGAIFGITDVRILDFPEPFRLDSYPESVERLRDIILETRPHMLITQSPYLTGPHRMTSGARDDHLETGFAVLEARTLAATPSYNSQTRPHTIAATYFPGEPSWRGERNQFDFVVDISDWYEQRVQAEMEFKSQGHTEAFARRRISTLPGSVGWVNGTMYAEGFVRERPDLLPRIIVPEAAIRHAAEERRTHHQRVSGSLETAAAVAPGDAG